MKTTAVLLIILATLSMCVSAVLGQTNPIRNPVLSGTGSVTAGSTLNNAGTLNGAGTFNFASGTVALPNTVTGGLTSFQAADADLTALAAIAGVQGDIIYHNGTSWVRLAKGTGLQGLRMNAGATAPEWATGGAGSVATDTIWDAVGDIVVGTGADTAGRLAMGTALQVLRVNAGATALEWVTPTSGTVTSITGSGGTTGLTLSGGPITSSGTLTLGGTLAVANGGTGITAFGTGVAAALAINTGTSGAFVVNGGALGSPSSAGTIPAFALGGTISGGGNQINNVIIGTTTPLAGSFTALANSGLQTSTGGTNSATPTNLHLLTNTTAATAGTQSASPSLIWTGQGWKTNATAGSQPVSFRAYVLPVQGAANPTGKWVLGADINATGTYTDVLTIDNAATPSLYLGPAGGANVNVGSSYNSGTYISIGANASYLFSGGSSYARWADQYVANPGFTAGGDVGTHALAISTASALTARTNANSGTWFRDTSGVWQAGIDDSTTATNQTVKAHDVTTGTGASMTIAGGKGSTAGGSVVLATSTTNGAPTAKVEAKANGSVAVGAQAALATNATDGFLYVPTCAGTPTGAPTAITGLAPIVIDTTNNKLYFYSGGAWRDAGP